MRALAIVALLAACGDNDLPEAAPLGPAHDLAIVAHQDDDLLFMQPDLLDAARAGSGVTIVYVTAGNDDRDLDYAEKRYTGVMAAYAAATETPRGDWRCGWLDLVGHTAEHCRLAAANLSLVFLGYPDGGKHGEFASSLLALWQGRIAGADTIADRTAHYDRDGLIATLAAAITATQPRTIRTLEVAGTHGVDHSDHMLVGAMAVLARERAGGDAELLSYRGYDITAEPANDFAPVTAIASDAFARYSACAEGCAACGEACATFSPTYAAYLHRHYAVHINRITTGALAGSAIQFDGTVSRTGTSTSPLMLDEEGHIWVATPPPTVTDLDHLECLAPGDGVPTATLCGGDGSGAPVWEVLPPTVSTSRKALGLAWPDPAAPSWFADLDGDGDTDWCSATANGPACGRSADRALSTDPVPWAYSLAGSVDATAAPTTTTAVLVDFDGDGRADFCAIDGTRVSCAFSHGTAFGPRTPVMELATTPTALWADASGALCADTGDTVTCARVSVRNSATRTAVTSGR